MTVQSLRTFGGHATDCVDLASDQGEISAVRLSACRVGLACTAAWSVLKTSIINKRCPGRTSDSQACDNRTDIIRVNIASPRGSSLCFRGFPKVRKLFSSSSWKPHKTRLTEQICRRLKNPCLNKVVFRNLPLIHSCVTMALMSLK